MKTTRIIAAALALALLLPHAAEAAKANSYPSLPNGWQTGDQIYTVRNGQDYTYSYLVPTAFSGAFNGNLSGAVNGVTLGTNGLANQFLNGQGQYVTVSTSGTLQASNNLSDLASAPVARSNLGLGSASTASATAFLQPGNNLSDIGSPTTARGNLGLGSAATANAASFLQAGSNLSDLPSSSTARINLGLGTAATAAASAFAQAANNLSDLASAAAARVNLGLGALATANSVNLATQATGILPAANVATLNQSTTGNAATATALAAPPTKCTTPGQFSTGVDAGGNSTCATPAAGGSSGITQLTGDVTTLANSSGSTAATLPTVNGSPGSYGSASSVPVITTNAKGLTTAVSSAPIAIGSSQVSGLGPLAGQSSVQPSQMPALTGDVASMAGSTATTLATANSAPGTFGSVSSVNTITVDGKGRVTSVVNNPISIGTSQVTGLVAGVSSVFGRAGPVTAQSGDYSVGQVTGAAPLASPTHTGVVTINSTGSALPAFPTGTLLGGYGSTGFAARGIMIGSDLPGMWTGARNSASALASNIEIGSFNAGGYDGSAMATGVAVMKMTTGETWSSTAHGTGIGFGVTPLGTTALLTNVVQISPGGQLLANFGAAVTGTFNAVTGAFSGAVTAPSFNGVALKSNGSGAQVLADNGSYITPASGGTGTVTNVSVPSPANGLTATVTNPTTTPSIALALPTVSTGTASVTSLFNSGTTTTAGLALPNSTAHALLIGEAGTGVVSAAVGAAGYALLSGGSTADPAFGLLNLANTTGTATVSQGGTGNASFPAYSVVTGNGTSALTNVPAGTAGLPLVSTGTTSAPAYGSITFGSAITGILPIAQGGTNATTAAAALDNLANNPTAGTSGLVARLTSNNYTVVASLSGLCGTVFSTANCQSFFGYYDPRWYGAKFDGVTVTNLTTTAGGSTVTASSFTSADVGKNISVWAGAAYTNAAGVTTTGNTAQIVNAGSTTGLKPGMMIYASNNAFPVGTYVTGVVSATVFTISQPAKVAGSALTFTAYTVVNATITAASSGSATLSTTTPSAVSGNAVAVYGTNDQAALQAANAAALTAGGGRINLPSATAIVSSSVIIDSNVSITGSGWGKSVLFWSSTSDMTTPVIQSRTQASGSSCTAALAYTQMNNQFSYFEINGLAATQTTYAVQAKGFGFSCSINSSMDHTYVHDTPATCLATDNSLTMGNSNLLLNCGRLGQSAAGSNAIGEGIGGFVYESYSFTNNIIINPAHYGIFLEAQTSTSYPVAAAVSGNTCYEGGNTGVASGYSASCVGNSGSVGMTITGNHAIGLPISNNPIPWNGFSVDNGTFGAGAGAMTVISGNTAYRVSNGIILTYSGLAPSSPYTAQTVISGNGVYNSVNVGIQVTPNASGSAMDAISLSDNTVMNSGNAGIAVIAGTAGSVVKNLNISDNIIGNNGQTIATDYRKAAIAFNSVALAGFTASNNTIFDDSTGTQKYGFSENTGTSITGSQITGNNLTGTATPFNLLGTYAGTIFNNIGASPTIIDTATSSSFGANVAIGTTAVPTTALTINGNTNYASSAAPAAFALTTSGYTVPANVALVRFNQTTAVTSATITLPTVTADNYPVEFNNEKAGAVTSLTFSPAVVGFTNASAFAANSTIKIRWDAGDGTWNRVQ